MRKHRRQIKRKKRGKKRLIKRINRLDTPITTRWTKVTTYILIMFEFVFVLWWLQDLILEWQDILIKLGNIVSIMKGWF